MYYEDYLKLYGYVEGLVGTDEDGNYVIVNIDDNEVSIRTLQSNGWVRENVYYKDGTEEEFYRK